MILIDCAEQGYAYHVINIVDLGRALKNGISFYDKGTYINDYVDFHGYFDLYKPKSIPPWVERKKAIFASIRFGADHSWHSHSAILKVKIQEDRCWICNENLANFIYEPFVLQNLEEFANIREYMRANGRRFVEEYWNNSISYYDNLKKQYDKKESYDAEILVMHHISPESIECLYIVSDHQIMSYKQWQEYFKPGNTCMEAQYNKYLHPESISSDWKTPGSQ